MTFEIYLLFKCRACGQSIPVKLNQSQATNFVNATSRSGGPHYLTDVLGLLPLTPPMHGCPVSRALVDGKPVEVEWRGFTELVGYSIPKYMPDAKE